MNLEERQYLLNIAEASIREGVAHGHPLRPDVSEADAALLEPGAAFITLRRGGRLRGCIGTFFAHRSLLEDIAENAYRAAFSDPRFPALESEEIPGLDVHISILSPAVSMVFDSEADLIRQLRPGVDGLLIEAGVRRATFLPSVWEEVPAPEDFLGYLKRKAGLPPNYWSDVFKASRYTTENFGGVIRAD